jgi:hypothetical protein
MADTAGSAGKRQPPAVREACDDLGSRRTAGGDLLQCRHVILSVLLVAAQKLKRHATTIEVAQLILELR